MLPCSARLLYRLRQFWRGLHASVTPAEQALVAQVLPPLAAALFAQLPRDAQRHSLNVLQGVQGAGPVPADLAVAALLHDVGKLAAEQAGVRINLWLRGPLVLLEAWSPDWLRRQGRADPSTGWRYALYVHFAHPTIGATWAREAGCSSLACWLIAHHQATVAPAASLEEQRLLAALQWADSRN
jgi:HD domain